MTQFAYTAVPLSHAVAGALDAHAQGAHAGASSRGVVAGREAAPDEQTLRELLRDRGLLAIEIRPAHMGDALRRSFGPARITKRDTVWFYSTLRTLLESHVPIESALSTMHELSHSPRLAGACSRVRNALRSGGSLADAVSHEQGLNESQHLALLRMGHESGKLAHAVDLVASSLERRQKLAQTVMGRLAYPIILMTAALGAVWVLATFVIPRFAETLSTLGGELPLPTALTLAASRYMVWALPPLVIASVIAWVMRRTLISPALKRTVAHHVLRLPVVGALVWHRDAGIACDLMATMLDGGGDLLSGISLAGDSLSSPIIAERLEAVRTDVREGVDLGESLETHSALPPMPLVMVRIGSRTGELPGALRRASVACAEAQQRTTDRLLVLMEPAIILFLAGIVSWVAYALIVGMLAMNSVGTL
jgi:type II secretory pathway component PulF